MKKRANVLQVERTSARFPKYIRKAVGKIHLCSILDGPQKGFDLGLAVFMNGETRATRWENRKEPEIGMTNDEFRVISSPFTAKEIAAGLGVSYGKVATWRRKVSPVRISVSDAERIRNWIALNNGSTC